METRRSLLHWNLAASLGKPPPSALRHVQLASLPRSQLKKLLATCPPPSIDSLDGHWIGINRGWGPAVVGTSQYIKELRLVACSEERIGEGTNILVCQVPFEELAHRGWNPERDRLAGQIRTQGNFVITAKKTTQFDYSLAVNPLYDPSRYLIDEVVQVDEGLLLGRARFQIGYVRIPVAYFALSRLQSFGFESDLPEVESASDANSRSP